MAISPILYNASIQQTDNVLQNQVKQVEKGVLDQGNIQAQEVKKEEQKAKQVTRSENSVLMEERYDAGCWVVIPTRARPTMSGSMDRHSTRLYTCLTSTSSRIQP